MAGEPLFRFTPSAMSAETLERIFVQREPLAKRLMELIKESAQTQNKHHTLLVGPRGIGKSHLVALVYYRVRAEDDLRERLRIAWLREEEWGVESYLDLLLRICRALQEETPKEFPAEAFEALYGMEAAEAQCAAEDLIKGFVGERTLLLIVENMDELFRSMGDKGQRQWRAFLQENAFSTILATSQSLFAGVSRQTSPFYGFFRVQQLEEFSVEEAGRLLQNIAQLREDRDLAAFLNDPVGRARVRTVHHLAGGNPRLYVIFAEFLSWKSLDELSGPFLKTLDELTPYYQARLSQLSVQQRKIVEYLCDRGAPATVKEVAQRCFISSQTASGQLGDLKEKGYVRDNPLGATGRDTYYELREPLMRICLAVKNTRNNSPARLMVDFLRLWYPVSELRDRLAALSPEAEFERECLELAIQAAEANPDPRIEACWQDWMKYAKERHFEKCLEISDEMVAMRPKAGDYLMRGMVSTLMIPSESIIAEVVESGFRDIRRAIELDPNNTHAWSLYGTALVRFGQWQDAIDPFRKSLEIDDSHVLTWESLALSYSMIEAYHKAIEAWDKAIELDPADATSWQCRAVTLSKMRRYEEALESYSKATEITPCLEAAWVGQIEILTHLGKKKEALKCCEKAIACEGHTGRPWHEKGQLLMELGQYTEAEDCFLRASILLPDADCPRYEQAAATFSRNDFERGLRVLEGALETFPVSETFPMEHLVQHTRGIVLAVFRSTMNPDDYRERVMALVRLCRKHKVAEALAPALVSSARLFGKPEMPTARAEPWVAAWQKVVGDAEEFSVPLRLVDVALRYQTTQNKRVLLELPVEERKVVEQVLGMRDEG